MSEYYFGLGRGKIKPLIRRKVDAIAARHGATFCNPTLPGDEPRFWFACRNSGEPFDSATACAVYADLDAAGLSLALWPESESTNAIAG